MTGKTQPAKLLSTAQAGARLNRSGQTIVRWIQEGTLRAYRVGKTWVLDPKDVDAMAKRLGI